MTHTEAIEHKVYTWEGKPTVVYSTDMLADSREYKNHIASPEDRAWHSHHRVSLDEEYFHPDQCHVIVRFGCFTPDGDEGDDFDVKLELSHKDGDLLCSDPQKIVLGTVLPLIKDLLSDEQLSRRSSSLKSK